MVNIIQSKIRVKDGFGISKVAISKLQTRNMENCYKIEDVELQALLDEDDLQI